MTVQTDMNEHFATIARAYRELRTTDEAPIHFIREALAGRHTIRGADIGCGAGRYDVLLLRELPRLHLTCIDINPEMLAELGVHLKAQGLGNFETLASSLEDLELPKGSFDCVFSFNAVHHFDFPTFLAKTARAIREEGQIFIYTRTRCQNSESIWGKHFPHFSSKETRLHTRQQMERWVEATGRLRLIAVKTFRYPRVASLERLLVRARNKHYSTFSLYDQKEFDAACKTFEKNVRRHFDDVERLTWHDENILLQVGY